MAWSRERYARVGLAILVAAWLLIAFFVRWRAVVVVDDRTYVEMAAGVRDHGLPYVTNTWSDVLPEAHPSFLVPKDGKLWGQYPPLYPYVLGPALAFGGLAALYKVGAVLFALLSVVVARLGKHVWGDELAGTIAAWLLSIGLPVVLSSVQTLSMPLTLLISSGALLAAVRALRERKTHFYVVTGLLAGAAIASHLIELAVSGSLCAVVVLAGRRDVRSLLRRGFAVGLPFVLVLAPVAWLDHVRCGSFNPFSYGPCPWWMCTAILEQSMTGASLLEWALPGIIPIGVAGAAFVALRSRRRERWLAVLACALVTMAIPPCRERALALIGTVWGYFVDSSILDLSASHPRYGSLGWMSGEYVIVGLLEASPWLALLVTARRRLRGRPRMLALLVVPLVALALELSMFGRLRGAYALGWPFMVPRYAMYSAPFAVTLVAGALARMRFDVRHLVVGVVIAAALVAWFAPTPTDVMYVRRVFLVRVVPLVALGLMLTLAFARRAPRLERLAPILAAIALAIGVGNSIGRHDADAVRALDYFTGRLERFEKLVPRRFAVVGWGPDSDPILALRGERDIAYLDFVESKDWTGFRRIVDVWKDEGRPVYGIFPRGGQFKWPYADSDLPAEQLDAQEEFWKIGPPRRRWNDPSPRP